MSIDILAAWDKPMLWVVIRWSIDILRISRLNDLKIPTGFAKNVFGGICIYKPVWCQHLAIYQGDARGRGNFLRHLRSLWSLTCANYCKSLEWFNISGLGGSFFIKAVISVYNCCILMQFNHQPITAIDLNFLHGVADTALLLLQVVANYAECCCSWFCKFCKLCR